MPLPAGVEKVTVSSGVPLTLPDGRWIEGKLLITGPDLVTIGEDDLTFGGGVSVPLVDGAFSVRLVATDATGMSPYDWTYTVTSKFTNAPNWVRYIRLPKASPSVVLADVVVPDPVVGSYATLIDPAALTGVVRTTGDQIIDGEKNFGERIPLGPGFDPEFDNQLARKAYVDRKVAQAGGGAVAASTDGRIDRQIITLTAAASWTIVTASGGIEIGTSVAASVGDLLWFSPSFMRTGGVIYLDMGIKAAGGGVSRYVSSGGATPEAEGYAPMYPQPAFIGIAGVREFVVQAGEVDGSGHATIVLAYKGPADGVNQKLYVGGGYSGAIWVANMGPAPS
ncbi:hypothetical protein ABZT17_44735 [Streptomyces sp. NPDC005648]|uniref:hypothetical protein n=1 Tax=Streptomyces sp. NPDC005648 TaxID=3157044 RepID=UPI0033AE1773